MSTAEAIIASSPEAAQAAAQKRTIFTIQQEQVEQAVGLIDQGDAGVPWPYERLNEMTDTLLPGTVTIVGAYTGSGKTTLLINTMREIARGGEPVLMFGTEQEASVLRIKVACSELAIDTSDAMRGRPSERQKEELRAALRSMTKGENARIHLYNKANPTPDEIEQAIVEYAKRGVRVFLLDHLGEVEFPDAREPEWVQMKRLVGRLKGLAVRLRVAIIAAAQVGKAETSQLSRHLKPELGGFMGGQAVCYKADVVLGIYQPLRAGVGDAEMREVRMGEKETDEIVEKNTMAIVLLKHREGKRLGRTVLMWVANNRIRPRLGLETEVPQEMYRPIPRPVEVDLDLGF